MLLNIFLVYKSSENKTLENVKLKEVEKIPKSLAIMLEKENEDGTYSYIESDTNSWPDDLVINYDKSGCIDTNGQIIEDSLTYNFETKIATVETGVTTKCYLYFDIDKTFAIYSETDNSLRFYNNNDYKTIESKETYNDLAVTSVYKNFINEKFTSISTDNGHTYEIDTPWFEKVDLITSIFVEDTITAIDTSNWFNSLKNVSYIDVNKLDVSNVNDMQFMFTFLGYNCKEFIIDGLEEWKTSNLTNMHTMFNSMGYNSEKFEIDLSNWDTSNVISMRNAFGSSGYNSKKWSIGDLSKWNTSKVETMLYMFHYAAYNAESINLDLSNWDTSNVINMGAIFLCFGVNAKELYIGNLSNWNTENVTDMSALFYDLGRNANSFDIGNLDGWNTSNVTNMSQMFNTAGRYSTYWNIGDISNWDVSKVTNMHRLFYYAGEKATNWSLNLSKWNIYNVKAYTEFMEGTGTKITPPNWVN